MRITSLFVLDPVCSITADHFHSLMLVVALSEEMAVDEDADSHHSKNCNADSVVEYIKFHY